MSPRFLAALIVLAAPCAQASVAISTQPTSNMSCSAGTCQATAANAVLNVDELAGMLATDDVKVVSGSAAKDIELDAPLSWTGAQGLTLDAFRSVTVNALLTVAGRGALTLATNDGGSGGMLRFKGRIQFSDTKSKLAIDGARYKLVDTVKKLAKAAKGLAVHVALARNINDKRHAYDAPPVDTLDGVFEGLGNVIANLTVNSSGFSAGLFGSIKTAGTVRDVGLTSATINYAGESGDAGALAASNAGMVQDCYATGHVSLTNANARSVNAGGLVGISTGTILRAHAAVDVSSVGAGILGGLLGANGFCSCNASVQLSYATGAVTLTKDDTTVGGLVGWTDGAMILNSYARGAVKGAGGLSSAGGLAGVNADSFQHGTLVSSSYSTGSVTAGADALVGGVIGVDTNPFFGVDYWDLDTSGITDPGQGAGSRNNAALKGLHTAAFKAHLPEFLDPSIWAQKAGINDGYPYLLANPPH